MNLSRTQVHRSVGVAPECVCDNLTKARTQSGLLKSVSRPLESNFTLTHHELLPLRSSQHPLWQSPLPHVLLSWLLSWRGQSLLLYQRPAAGRLWEFVALSQKGMRGAEHRGQHNPLLWGLFHHDECHWGWVAMSSHL